VSASDVFWRFDGPFLALPFRFSRLDIAFRFLRPILWKGGLLLRYLEVGGGHDVLMQGSFAQDGYKLRNSLYFVTKLLSYAQIS
jgi:hypothetical protein